MSNVAPHSDLYLIFLSDREQHPMFNLIHVKFSQKLMKL